MPVITIKDGDNPNWQFRAAGNQDTLQTSPMGDCWALIVVNPDGSRLLAHLPAGDANQLNGGGLAAVNAHIVHGARVTLVMGLANQNESAYFINVKYQNLAGLVVPATPGQTLAGFYANASVDAAGNVKAW
jgi:hypothetical protein